LALLDAHDGYWEGTSTELVRKLQELDPTNRGFQKLSASSVGKKLSASLKSDLAAVGVTVKQGKGSKGQRFLILSRIAESQKTMPQVSQTPTPSLDKEEEQSPPVSPPSVTPEKNNGVAVPNASSSFTSAPARPEAATRAEVAVTVNGRVHNTEGRVTVSSPPITSTQTGLPVSPPDNGNGHSSYSSDFTEIGLPLAHEGIPPWLWDG
jgi:hypothetical protein